MLNSFHSGGKARLSYGASDYLILKAGTYVVCAVTGKKILLEDLRYWNAELQEAYVDAAASLKRWQETRS